MTSLKHQLITARRNRRKACQTGVYISPEFSAYVDADKIAVARHLLQWGNKLDYVAAVSGLHPQKIWRIKKQMGLVKSNL